MRLIGGHASFQTDTSRLSDRLTVPPPHLTPRTKEQYLHQLSQQTHINLLMAALIKYVCVTVTGQGFIC